MVSGVYFRQSNCILVLVSVTIGLRIHVSLHRFYHHERRFRWSSIYRYYSVWKYVWCDEGCVGRFMGCSVVPTPRNLFICGRSHHSCGHGNFRDIYLGISIKQTLQGVYDALKLPIDKGNLRFVFLHFGIGGVTKFACILVNNILSSGSVQG